MEIWPFEEYAADPLWNHSLDGLSAILQELKELNQSISLSIIFMGETLNIDDLSDDLVMSRKIRLRQLLNLPLSKIV
ncbi:hypothetical protein [Coxiella endosymbiont of Ornithodoros maritimus]|uniref:hypothetical protein n=1 Tax=Coxiella endosymbiont of Ornithodoros maritimus TaxID=1656172 RepID=UPI002B3FFCC1|nr:hypothetical protein [Coxiella endosymbiont of Ornithodoros maritimus]